MPNDKEALCSKYNTANVKQPLWFMYSMFPLFFDCLIITLSPESWTILIQKVLLCVTGTGEDDPCTEDTDQ